MRSRKLGPTTASPGIIEKVKKPGKTVEKYKAVTTNPKLMLALKCLN